MRPTYSLFSLIYATTVIALGTEEWKKQSIYQVLTDRFARTDGSTTAPCYLRDYCGGTWRGLINHLDYIQDMGFTAVWISPIVKNIEADTAYGWPYHGYWAQDIWSLNSHFGTEDDLTALADALHGRNMYLMVDVVTNHMGFNGCGPCVNYSIYGPFDSPSYFHTYCSIDYDIDISVVVCWQGDDKVSLPDLRTEESNVRSIFYDWINTIVNRYSIDGLRIDSVKHVEKEFWPAFEASSGVFNLGEVLDGNPSNIFPWLDYMSGVMNYPVFWLITRAFESSTGSMSDLVNGINTMKGSSSFLENHDQARFPSLTNDMAIAFTMLMDGIPIIYQGQEQHFSGSSDPDNREALWTSQYNKESELYGEISALNKIRTHAIRQDEGYVDYQAWPIYSDLHTVAMRKGHGGTQIIGLFSNLGQEGASYAASLAGSATGLSSGESVVDVLGCTVYTADSSGGLSLQVDAAPKVLYPASKLSGSGLCTYIGPM